MRNHYEIFSFLWLSSSEGIDFTLSDVGSESVAPLTCAILTPIDQQSLLAVSRPYQMGSTKDEEDLGIDYDCLPVDRESRNLTLRRSSEGNTNEKSSSAVERAQQAFVEAQPLVQEEERKKQNYLESIIRSKRFKIGLLILFILLISALILLVCLYARRGADIEEARNNASALRQQVDELNAVIASHGVDINQLINKLNELAPEQTSVMLLGGWHGDITNSTTIYNSMEKSWEHCKLTLPSALATHGASVLNNEIYIFGGHENETTLEPLKSLYKLGAGNKWERMADMNEKRIFLSSVVFNSEIWVIGGSDETNTLNSVEKFNPKTKEWTEMPELNESRSHAAATVVDGKIYVSGGMGRRKSMDSMEVYDPEKGKWEIFTPSMPYEAHVHILIGNNSHLIAIGGHLALHEPTNQVWKMDVLDPKREWKVMPFLRQRRYHSGAAIIADELMVFGGFTDYFDSIDSVEIFDGVEWKNGAPLPEMRGGFAYIPLTYAQERLFLKRFCQNS